MSVNSAIDNLKPAQARAANATVRSAPTGQKRMGRPPMTPEQREAAAREREAKKLANAGTPGGEIKRGFKAKNSGTSTVIKNGNGVDGLVKRLETELANAEKALAAGQKQFDAEEKRITRTIETANAELTKLDDRWNKEKESFENVIKRLRAAVEA